jgi:HD-like signal output (HDOD) protein/prolyl-tRNA editing enzyme YbaK/EbsC (Cys-tRNA(Pro) deacylase)
MAIAASIKRFLDRYRVYYRVFSHPRTYNIQQSIESTGIDKAKVVTATILKDSFGYILAVYLLGHKIDFEKLKAQLNRNLILLPEHKANQIFRDCESGSRPPLGEAYGLEVVLDTSTLNLDKIYLEAGSHTSLIEISGHDFCYINSNSKKFSFTKKIKTSRPDTNEIHNDLLLEHEKFLTRSAIPQIPKITQKILNLLAEKSSVSNKLVDLSTEFNQIFLSYDYDTDKIYNKFWQHAYACAELAKKIAKQVNNHREIKLNINLVHLLGFMHNIGLFVFANLFPPEFRLLEKWRRLNPKLSISILEKKLLGMGHALNIVPGGHTDLGHWLMCYWDMPEPFAIVAQEHHNLSYSGSYAEYVKIIQISNQLLAIIGIGDERKADVSRQLLDFFHISEQEMQAQLSELLASTLNAKVNFSDTSVL